MATIYEVIFQAIELVFPIAIVEHLFFGFILEFLVFSLALSVLVITAYIPIIIAIRLALRGVKKWF